VSEQETRKEIQRLARNPKRIFNALQKLDKTLQKPARNSEKRFETLQEIRQQKRFKILQKTGRFFRHKT
jgi:hypothetical protein